MTLKIKQIYAASACLVVCLLAASPCFAQAPENSEVQKTSDTEPANAGTTTSSQTAVPPSSSQIQGSTQKKPELAKKIFRGIDNQVKNAVAFVAGDASLPPSVDDNASWPFLPARHKRAVYKIMWNDGQTSSIIPRPDGGFTIVGGDAGGTNLMPVQGGFAIMGRGGDFGTMTREPGGGFRIMSADGTLTSVTPRPGGGYCLSNAQGAMGTVVPGPGGSHYGFGSERNFFSFQIP